VNLLQLSGLFLVIIATFQHQESDLIFTGVPEPESLPPSSPALELELVREYGDRDEGLVFGNIVDLAVSESGTLAVLDQHGCQIWMVDTETGESRTVGGCGDGPAEFRDAQGVTFSGDTLLVWDFGRASLVKLDLEGEEIKRSFVSLFEIGAGTILDLHAGRDGSILAGLDLLPNGISQEHRQLAVFSGSGGSIERRGLGAPPLARTTPRNILRSVSFCVGNNAREEEVVLALNTWGPQAALLRRTDLEVLRSLRIPLEWARSEEHTLRPGHWGPMAPRPRAACGSRYAVAGYRDQGAGPDGDVAVSSSAMVLFDLWENTMTVLGGDEPPEPGSVLFMTPGAANGNRFFFLTNTFFDHPVVREYRLVQQQPDQ